MCELFVTSGISFFQANAHLVDLAGFMLIRLAEVPNP